MLPRFEIEPARPRKMEFPLNELVEAPLSEREHPLVEPEPPLVEPEPEETFEPRVRVLLLKGSKPEIVG